MKAFVLGLYSITPVHPGSGSEISVIDLPIQRERHTGFPVIWGQSLKGSLRSSYKGNYREIIFGPENAEHAGAISVGDAKVLLFPVRSLKGVFSYVTSPLVLRRFVDDMRMAGLLEDSIDVSLKIGDNEALVVTSGEHLNVHNGKAVLEDLVLGVRNKDFQNDGLKKVLEKIKSLLPEDRGNDLEKRLVVVSDDVFSIFVKTTTEIVTRIKINPTTGTVDKNTGALWYEEFLPSDTLMYSVILMNEGRTPECSFNEDNLVRDFMNGVGTFIQLGGDETVGKGFVRITYLGDENGEQ